MRYHLLGRSGLRVSEVSLGTMTFGSDWGWGADKGESEKQFNHFVEKGGNFIDTANRYTEGTSERFVGEMVRQIGRERFVVATKYSLVERKDDPNGSGNHKKNLVHSVEASLKRLGLDCIDLLYLHAWDFTTPVEEVMRSLDDLVRLGKVLYIGVSDTPAWLVSRANTMAELRAWSRFIALQIEYSLIQRDAERELIPMAEALGLGVLAWAPLAGGVLSGKYLNESSDPKRIKEGNARLSEKNTLIVRGLLEIAKSIGSSPTHVALAWLRQKGEQIIPIIGARNVFQLEDSLRFVDLKLSEEVMTKLNTLSQIDLGFPHTFLSSPGVNEVLFAGKRDKIIFQKRA